MVTQTNIVEKIVEEEKYIENLDEDEDFVLEILTSARDSILTHQPEESFKETQRRQIAWELGIHESEFTFEDLEDELEDRKERRKASYADYVDEEDEDSDDDDEDRPEPDDYGYNPEWDVPTVYRTFDMDRGVRYE